MRSLKRPSIAGRLGGAAAFLLIATAAPADRSALAASSSAPTSLARSSSTPAPSSLASRFIGTWKLIAIRDRDAATGTESPAARAADDGQLVYAANGRLSVQIARKGRENAPKGSADGFSSYFGRWELLATENCLIHHQDGNLNYAQTGQAAKRCYSFDTQGHLSLATPPSKREDGRLTSTVFVWEKIP